MIPENKKNIVRKALKSAFGVDSYDDIKEITTGLSSALTFRVVVKNKPYLMKIARTDELSAPANYYEYMKEASDAGIAPHVWYISTEDKISITDFIEAKPFPTNKAKEIMPKLLDKLHKLPPFHKSFNYFDAMDGIVQRFFQSKFLSGNLSEEIIKNYALLKEIYPCHSEDLVSCHNDLKPENYIFDGEKVWLVDWEAAFLNDPYLDLAVVGNFIVSNENDELQYLENYFGEYPNDYIRARFFLMQQLLHIFYMATFMLYSSRTIPIEIDSLNADFIDFHKSMWEGQIDLSNDENKLKYAIVHMNKFLYNIKTKRLEEAISILTKVKKS